MILACNNIKKAFIDKVVIENASFHIEEREKAAIVGVNGAGKSTLLKIIMGLLPPDEGEVTLAKGRTIGYLAQHQDLQSGRTIYEEMLEVKKDVIRLEEQIRTIENEMKHKSGEALEVLLSNYSKLNHQFELQNGYAYNSEINGVLKGLGFEEDEFTKMVDTLSGGQKTRVSLGKLLLSHPDIILLDEPTNHLDMESISWLETFLLNYNGSVIIVAHDRYFLDKVVTKIIEIDNCKVRMFTGNYSAYSEKKRAIMDALMKQYLNQQREIKRQEEVITKLKSFNREKSIKRAESREKMLDKIEVLDKPITDDSVMNIRLEPGVQSGNDVLTVTGLSKSFGTNNLFSNIDFEMKRGERVAIIGNNGTGKTTLLKIINGYLPADSGKISLGSKVNIGYYDQEHHVLHMEKTLFEEISDTYPNMTNTEIRNILAAFLFTGDDVFKRISELSGGERGRVSLAKLMLSDSNFLILDEPTNHLDMMSKEILEQALNNYTGTVLYVSHDRYFINKTATRILELTGQTFINYIGNYDYYLEKRDILTSAVLGSTDTQTTQTPTNASTS
ncbi:MAG: ABC-F family ATP-binding cassette domain-containing protein [Lachnospiraceae bacterium]